MTLDLVLPSDLPRPTPAAEPPRLALVPPLAVTPAQQEFVAERDRLLPRAGVSGERSTTALYLILRAHGAELRTTGAGRTLCCATCAPADGAAPASYPCVTAEQALWALAATLS